MILIFLQLDMDFTLQARKAEPSRRVTAKLESKLPEKVARVLCLKFLLRYDGGYVSRFDKKQATSQLNS